MIGVALLFGKIIFGGNDQSEITNAGGIEPRRIDFVEDAMADREPNLAASAAAVPTALLALEVQRGAMPGAPGGVARSLIVLPSVGKNDNAGECFVHSMIQLRSNGR